ncbi:tRNA(Met) cytidine acetyltransferase TmcA [Vreelandella utahensis]|uniref:tRNA(Met) cytidine acetyltransferase TmcA n=1 Tax=Vreelandella halophila TaxID=86177 RepID=UPI000985BA5C|nr:GNAT family N-acetyltransferase [Halomonas utahensis]
MEAALSQWLQVALPVLRARRHRGVLVLAGPADWGRALAADVAAWREGDGLWVGDADPAPDMAHCTGAQARQWLGRNLSLIVWDSHAGTHPAGLGAVSGALVGGGLLVWLVPPLAEWAQGSDPDYDRLRQHAPPYRFLSRVARLLGEAAEQPPNALVTPEVTHAVPPESPTVTRQAPEGPTSDQSRAIETILAMGRAATPAPVVLRADRGRGKSAALGMAATRLVREWGLRVCVTAARPSALDSFWAFVAAGCREQVLFRAPDELLRHPPVADVLMVDEAATLPVPMLAAMTAHWPGSVLATTVHGYEGTGRGFDLRFRGVLERDYPAWQRVMLEEPIRWAPDDPLEDLMNRLLCLDADLPATACPDEPVAYRVITQDELLEDDSLLKAVMGLLVSAHYQTSPDDLRQLLDDPETVVVAALQGDTPVGVAWGLHEGGLDADLARSVWLGERRPRGHLVAQSLAFQGGDPAAAQRRYLRVTRIAVHPDCRRRRIGQRLLAAMEEIAVADGVDVLATSFGATPELLAFWQAAGFRFLRLGTKRDAASGTHAVMLGRPLTHDGLELCRSQGERFAAHWPWLLPALSSIEPEVRTAVEAMMPTPPERDSGTLSSVDWREIEAFAKGARELEVSRLPLARLAAQDPSVVDGWTEEERRLWQRSVNEGAGWEALRRERLVVGRRPGLKRLRALARCLVEEWSESGV